MSGSLTDIAGIRVGHAEDRRALSGVTAIVFDAPTVAGVDIRGGGPGTRETDLLDPERTVPGVDALVLSGGSVFGLDAASGVTAWLAETGRGFAVGPARVPIVPAAILFDLLNGGDKAWGRDPPYRDLGFTAAAKADTGPVAMGSVGAGLGARTANIKGGLGSASATVEGTGLRVAALVAVNALGRVTVGDGPHFWAAPFEIGAEFGGLGSPATPPPGAFAWRVKPMPGANTTIAVVATDARLTKAEARRLAVMLRTASPGRSCPPTRPSTATWSLPPPPARCRSPIRSRIWRGSATRRRGCWPGRWRWVSTTPAPCRWRERKRRGGTGSGVRPRRFLIEPAPFPGRRERQRKEIRGGRRIPWSGGHPFPSARPTLRTGTGALPSPRARPRPGCRSPPGNPPASRGARSGCPGGRRPR